jgi:hypothetical protein
VKSIPNNNRNDNNCNNNNNNNQKDDCIFFLEIKQLLSCSCRINLLIEWIFLLVKIN